MTQPEASDVEKAREVYQSLEALWTDNDDEFDKWERWYGFKAGWDIQQKRIDELTRKLGYRQGIAHGFEYVSDAHRVKELEERNKRLEEALREIYDQYVESEADDYSWDWESWSIKAYAALSSSKGEGKGE